ncbi:folate-binding protein YgfZ [Hydrogenophaga palleronii]|uniref:Folate-binding protein YgfZ n=1 Tax=Hydrogenophaga palleronii TaxID=65655 RepID=A0ABU1WI29_9BURK|nr:folate-binding protein [Hydrogenophaga palleronii]MDR7148930.1 folate-binding protein YgfZ [Hydrogenophaga palleronii]
MSDTSNPSPDSLALNTPDLQGAARLNRLGVIRVQGADAAQFLHGQLTQDFALLGPSEARLAAFCSAKGRMLASFIGVKRGDDEILLVCSRDLLPPTLKRLSMFVLRAKAKISDASDEFQVWGLAGSAVPRTLPEKVWSKTAINDALVVRLYPASTTPRALWLAPAEQPAPQAPLLNETDWDWLEVMSGVAMLGQPVVEAFVPQMLNYESVGGVNFKKGCYPGQEVVARSQFRGTLKRRAYIVHSASPLEIGQPVFHESDAEQPCGTVAAAGARPGDGWNAIVSMQTSAAASGRLNAGSPDGPPLQLLELPYPLLEDI